MKYTVREFRKTIGDSKGRGVWRDGGDFEDVSDLAAVGRFFEYYCRRSERLSEGPYDGIMRLHDKNGDVIATYTPAPGKLAAVQSVG